MASSGLQSHLDQRLAMARERTAAFRERFLEALFAILVADRDTALEEILAGPSTRLSPTNVTEALVGEAFSRLDPAQQRIMQALAVYGRPVPPTAVDFPAPAPRPRRGQASGPIFTWLVEHAFPRVKEASATTCTWSIGIMARRACPAIGEVADRGADRAAVHSLWPSPYRSAKYFGAGPTAPEELEDDRGPRAATGGVRPPLRGSGF